MQNQERRLLDDNALGELDEMLANFPEDSDVMDLGVLDGYLTAAALNPTPLPKEEIIAYIFSNEGKKETVPTDNPRLLELIGWRLQEIEAALIARGGFDPIIFPVLDENDNVVKGKAGLPALEPWAMGFVTGVQNWDDELFDSEELLEKMAPIMAHLNPENFEDKEATAEYLESFPLKTPPKDLEEGLFGIVNALFDIKVILSPNVPQKNEGPKVGRNDPCPCGSNKKYKQCCGKN